MGAGEGVEEDGEGGEVAEDDEEEAEEEAVVVEEEVIPLKCLASGLRKGGLLRTNWALLLFVLSNYKYECKLYVGIDRFSFYSLKKRKARSYEYDYRPQAPSLQASGAPRSGSFSHERWKILVRAAKSYFVREFFHLRKEMVRTTTFFSR